MRTCFVHIGAPKAGSTSIQRFLQVNKEALAELGLVSPGLKSRQNFLVSMFHTTPLALPFNQAFADEAEFRTDLAVQQEAFEADLEEHANGNFIISNEQFLHQATKMDVRRLYDFLKRYTSDIRLLICVRDPVQAAISRAQEMVKGGRDTFDEVVQKVPIVPIDTAGFYIRVFGKENTIAIKMESGQSILNPFAAAVGIPAEALVRLDTRRVNESISLEAALIASYAPVSREAKTGKRRAIRPAQLSMIGSTKFSVPARALKARWGELEEQYRYASDNLGITFDRPDLEAWRDPEPNWDDATLASIAAALSELTGTQDKLRRARRRLANGRRKAASRRREAQFA